MASFQGSVKNMFVSYWRIFRLIFVIFFLYLLGDVFYRWGAFEYFASFEEFLSSVGLISIIWVVAAAFMSLVVQFSAAVISFIYRTLVKLFAWLFRNESEVRLSRTTQWKDRTGQLLGIIQERITPLVWLFGLWIVISVPLVAYQTWGKGTDKEVSQQNVSVPVTNEKRPNILLITFDALRARSMSVYGYDRPTTPFMSEWAKSATVFTQTRADSLNTYQTTPCIITGKRVWSHQVFHELGNSLYRNKEENLAAVLKKNGYHTMLLSANRIVDAKKLGVSDSIDMEVPFTEAIESSLWIGRNYAHINVALFKLFNHKIHYYNWVVHEDFLLGKILFAFGLYKDFNTYPFPPEKLFSKFIEIRENNPSEPYFAWIHIMTPHSPYLAPPPYMGMFEPSDEYRTFKPQDKARKLKTPGSFSILRGRYDELIRYSDKKFEEFIKELEAKDLLKNTIIIVSADHGESFERGEATHGSWRLNEESVRIPLIIKSPLQERELVVPELVEQIDIPATILGLSHISVPAWMEGRSLAPLIRGETLPPKPVLSMSFDTNPALGRPITKGSIAVWEGDYKLVHLLDKGESFLYNLKNDPDELNNLFENEPDVGQRLLALLLDNLELANERIISEK